MSQWIAWAFKPSSSTPYSSSPSPFVESNRSEGGVKHNIPTENPSSQTANPSTAPQKSLPPSIIPLSPSEFSALQKENSVLREALNKLKGQIQKQNGFAPSTHSTHSQDQDSAFENLRGFLISAEEDVQKVRELTERKLGEIHSKRAESVEGVTEEFPERTLSESPSEISADSPSFPRTYDRQPLLVLNQTIRTEPKGTDRMDGDVEDFADGSVGNPTEGPGDNLHAEVEEEVAIVDIPPDEWWTIIQPNEAEDDEATKPPTPSTDHLDGDFVVLKQNDFNDALAEFILKAINSKYPEAKKIPPRELRALLDESFKTLKTPNSLQQAVQWGKFMYSTYGWGQFAWNLYREPYVAKLVASGVFQAATWILVLVM